MLWHPIRPGWNIRGILGLEQYRGCLHIWFWPAGTSLLGIALAQESPPLTVDTCVSTSVKRERAQNNVDLKMLTGRGELQPLTFGFLLIALLLPPAASKTTSFCAVAKVSFPFFGVVMKHGVLYLLAFIGAAVSSCRPILSVRASIGTVAVILLARCSLQCVTTVLFGLSLRRRYRILL